MPPVVRLSFRPSFGFDCEGNANIVVGDEEVAIGYYIWSGDVLGVAKKFAQAMVDKKLTYIKEKSDYGNGHGMACFKIEG